MNINAKSKENMTMKELYNLTKNPEIKKMSSIKGEDIEVGNWLVYTEVNKDGEAMTVLSIEDRETSEIFATNSQTFINEFYSIIDMCSDAGEELHTIKVHNGKSKAGREFITCVYIG